MGDSYISAVLSEVAFYVKKYRVSSWKTIYVGGGTPSLLGASQLKNLLDGVKALVPTSSQNPPEEVTVEMNPESVRKDFVDTAKSSGVTRFSLGIQAFDDSALEAVYRRARKSDITKALDLLKAEWKGRLSVDFIAGLPSQTEKSFKSQFDLLDLYPVDHVSLYTLTIEENTPLAKLIEGGKVRWNPDRADRRWILGRNILQKKGFFQYEVSNFARPGFESVHNSSYWKLENYIGVGAGATGTVYGEKLEAGGADLGFRRTNGRNIKEYSDFWLSHSALPDDERNLCEIEKNLPAATEVLDSETQEFEYLMTGFRMLEGIDSEKFYSRFGRSLEKRIGADTKDGAFSRWKSRRLAHVTSKNGRKIYALNLRGLLMMNAFLEELL